MCRLILRGSGCLALLACFIGCPQAGNEKAPATAPVTGTVTYKGAAVEGAVVTFSPASSGGSAAVATTDAQGNFTLKSQWGTEGAEPGNYKVAISKSEVEGGPGGEEEIEDARIGGAEEAPAATVTEDLPAKYKSAETSGLTAEVKADTTNEFKFDLTD